MSSILLIQSDPAAARLLQQALGGNVPQAHETLLALKIREQSLVHRLSRQPNCLSHLLQDMAPIESQSRMQACCSDVSALIELRFSSPGGLGKD